MVIPLPETTHPIITQRGWDFDCFERLRQPGVFLPIDSPNPLDEDDYQVHRFTRQKFAASLDFRFGAWVWNAWVDEYGHAVAGPAEWKPNPQAFLYGEWNPPQR